MRLLFLFAVLLFCAAAKADTWKSDATPLSFPANSHYTGASPSMTWRAFFVDGAGNQLSGTSTVFFTGAGSSASSAINTTMASQTRTQDFAIIVARCSSGTVAASKSTPTTISGVSESGWQPVYWIAAYKVGDPDEPQASGSGPFVDGNPVYDDGSPADPMTGSPPNNSHKACVTLVCPASALEPRYFRVTGKVGTNIIYDQIIPLSPGETRSVCVTNSVAFTLTAEEVYPKTGFNPDQDSTVGSDINNPDDWIKSGSPTTVNSTGQTAAPPASGNAEGTNVKTGQAASDSQPAAANVARPGTTEGNADARNQELRNELQRLTDQVKASGDATKAGINDTNKLLGDIKGATGGAGDAGSGAPAGTPSASGLSFAQSIGEKASGLGSALGNLLSAAGLGANPGTNALTWEVPVMGNSVTLSVEDHADVFAVVRTAILWVASVLFVWASFSIVRGAFVDEGK